jgi:hypothetical protein
MDAQGDLKAKGIDLTICVATNDAYVMEVRFLSHWDLLVCFDVLVLTFCLLGIVDIQLSPVYMPFLDATACLLRPGDVLQEALMQAFVSLLTTRGL